MEQPPSPDVVFVSYDEANADENYRRLKAVAPRAKRLHGVAGIGHAYRAAGELSATANFFMVDGDSWVLDDFDFQPPQDFVPTISYLWTSRNAVNGILSLNGDVKFLSKSGVMALSLDAIDYFGSIPLQVISLPRVASESRFNTSSFAAWRAGFRECAKLAGGVIQRTDVGDQLRVWQSQGSDRPHGVACILGARLGAAFGASHWQSRDLARINDPGFLRAEYSRMQAKFSGSIALDPHDAIIEPQPLGSGRILLNNPLGETA